MKKLTYLMLVCDSGAGGKFPSSTINHSALFCYPKEFSWPKVRKFIYKTIKNYGFKQKDATFSQIIERGNWTASKKWSRFEWDVNEFKLVESVI